MSVLQSKNGEQTIDVSILIVCYKSLDLISQCLSGLYEHTSGVTYEVLLLDCSNDGTVELVRKQFPQTVVIENSENLGYGKGNNVLAEHARGKYIILLNPDVIIRDNAIGELYQTAVSMPRAGAIGGWSKLPNGQRDPGVRQCIPTLFRMFVSAVGGARFFNGALPESATAAQEVETLSGAFMLVRSDAWREIHGFDTSFFMYSEELDLCCQLRRRGWGIVMTPRAEIIHLGGSGEGKTPQRTQWLTTSRMHFLRKYWTLPMVWLAGSMIWAHALIRVGIGAVGSPFRHQDWARPLLQAYLPIVVKPRTWWYGFQKNHRA